MEKLMIYPYSKAYEPYVSNEEILEGYMITALVSPRGWGYEGDIVVDRQDNMYMVTADFTEKLDGCTCVWFVADGRQAISKELLREKIREAVKRGKRILYTRYGDDYYEEMKQLIPTELYIEKTMKLETLLNLSKDRTYDIDTPVIVIAGLGQDTDKLAVEFILMQKFREKGYSSIVISSRQDGDWKGIYSMPGFIFDHSVGETEKIIKLNHYVKEIEIREEPDVLLVGVPGAVLPLDEINHNEFGILAYEISFAVPCDAAVICMPYQSQFNGNYSQLAEDMKNRFGFRVEGIHMAAVVQDAQEFYAEKKLSYVSIEQKVVDRKMSEIHSDSVWNIRSEQGAERAVSRIIDVLSD